MDLILGFPVMVFSDPGETNTPPPGTKPLSALTINQVVLALGLSNPCKDRMRCTRQISVVPFAHERSVCGDKIVVPDIDAGTACFTNCNSVYFKVVCAIRSLLDQGHNIADLWKTFYMVQFKTPKGYDFSMALENLPERHADFIRGFYEIPVADPRTFNVPPCTPTTPEFKPDKYGMSVTYCESTLCRWECLACSAEPHPTYLETTLSELVRKRVAWGTELEVVSEIPQEGELSPKQWVKLCFNDHRYQQWVKRHLHKFIALKEALEGNAVVKREFYTNNKDFVRGKNDIIIKLIGNVLPETPLKRPRVDPSPMAARLLFAEEDPLDKSPEPELFTMTAPASLDSSPFVPYDQPPADTTVHLTKAERKARIEETVTRLKAQLQPQLDTFNFGPPTPLVGDTGEVIDHIDGMKEFEETKRTTTDAVDDPIDG